MANWNRWHKTKAEAVRTCQSNAQPGSSVWQFESKKIVYFRDKIRKGFFILNGSRRQKDLPAIMAKAGAKAWIIYDLPYRKG